MVPTYIREEERKEGKGKEEKREERKIERKMKDGILHTSLVVLLPLKAALLVLRTPSEPSVQVKKELYKPEQS